MPLFSLVLIKANIEHPVTSNRKGLYSVNLSDSKYIEHFLREEDLHGEQGYILVTLQTSLSFISCLTQEQIVLTAAHAGI